MEDLGIIGYDKHCSSALLHKAQEYQNNSALLQKAAIKVAVSSFHLLLCGPPVSENKAMLLKDSCVFITRYFYLFFFLEVLTGLNYWQKQSIPPPRPTPYQLLSVFTQPPSPPLSQLSSDLPDALPPFVNRPSFQCRT